MKLFNDSAIFWVSCKENVSVRGKPKNWPQSTQSYKIVLSKFLFKPTQTCSLGQAIKFLKLNTDLAFVGLFLKQKYPVK